MQSAGAFSHQKESKHPEYLKSMCLLYLEKIYGSFVEGLDLE